jgi:DNA-binding CsgD family transcriptional regulator/PAS domain-containing protein
LIELAYAASDAPARWQDCLEALVDSLAATGATLLHHDHVSDGAMGAAFGVDSEALSLYATHYAEVDPWAKSPRAPALAVPGTATLAEALLPRDDLKRTEFYPFVCRYGLSRMMRATLARDNRWAAGISVYRAESDLAFGCQELAFFQAVAPHLARALQIHQRLTTTEHERRTALDALEALPCGVILLDADGRIVHANGAAREVLAVGEGLYADRSVLRAESSADNRTLRTLCASVAGGYQGLPHPGGAMSIRRRSGPVPLQVLVSPVTKPNAQGFPTSGAVTMVFVSDPLRGAAPNEKLLEAFYRLTPTEAQIAARIASGHSLEAIATDRHNTLETIRWYSKQIQARTGCHSRAELVRQLSRTLASLFQNRPESATK